ncbi:hypothetical protein C8Q80DRAFT_217156 [Daedaleopsis nitida]|nr:hypothetical protein C8Q80DRAFT_217156 [Daedaleopsis nitida]
MRLRRNESAPGQLYTRPRRRWQDVREFGNPRSPNIKRPGICPTSGSTTLALRGHLDSRASGPLSPFTGPSGNRVFPPISYLIESRPLLIIELYCGERMVSYR